jgi:drug/metabolite transporter (DMT)-like permease
MKIALGMLIIVASTIVANVLLKLGAVSDDSSKIFFRVLGWTGIAGLCFYAVAGLIYAWVLKFIPLHLAQVIVAAQFIGVILAARLFLSENINAAQWGGVALIAAGIVITGWSFDPA